MTPRITIAIAATLLSIFAQAPGAVAQTFGNQVIAFTHQQEGSIPPVFLYGSAEIQIGGVSLETIPIPSAAGGEVWLPKINIDARGADASPEGDRFVIVTMTNSPNGAEQVPTNRFGAACGDIDGCQIRLGIQKAGEENISFIVSSMVQINPSTGRWTASPMSRGSTATQVVSGQDSTGGAQNLVQADTCYLSDGEYSGMDNGTVPDDAVGFFLASFPAGRGACVLTVID